MNRREFLGSAGAALLASLPADSFAQRSNPPVSAAWDAGRVRHLLPTVSDTRMLIKASCTPPLAAAPTLRIGATAVRGRMTDTAGECWGVNGTRTCSATTEGSRPPRRNRTGRQAGCGSTIG